MTTGLITTIPLALGIVGVLLGIYLDARRR